MMSVERLRHLSVRAVLGGWGVVERPRLVRLKLEMDCEDPIPFELFARSRKISGRVVYTVYGALRCRKCAACAKRKAMFWTGRAITEYHRSARTWFGTLTLSPDEHHLIDARAQVRLGTRGVAWQQLSAREQFAERAKEVGVEMTLYVKRLRKGDADHVKPRIRYLMVAEVHDSAPPNVKERKSFMVGGKAAKIYGGLTEFRDFLDCLAGSMPGQPCKPVKNQLHKYVACIVANEHLINMPEATVCMHQESAKDAAYSLPDRMGRPRDNPFYQRPVGPTTGFWSQPSAPSMTKM